MGTTEPTNTDQESGCLIRQSAYCDRHELFPVNVARFPCFCYAMELCEMEGLPRMKQAVRLNRAVAIMALRAQREADDLVANQQET